MYATITCPWQTEIQASTNYLYVALEKSGFYERLMPCLHETHLPEVNYHFYCTALHFLLWNDIYLT